MDWDLLRIFLAVARSGQLLGAARKLGLNHATVSRRLAALEEKVGTHLFDRTPTGSLLTQAGELLLPVAERIESEVLAASEALREVDAEVSGLVRIGAPDGLGNLFLARELGTLAQQHPGLVIELVPLPRAFSLSRREADIAITLDRPTQGRLISAKLTDYSLSVYASAGYLERFGTPATAKDLGEHVIVTGVEDFAYASALDYNAVMERRAKRLFRCASVTGQLEAIRSGTGIGVLHDFAAQMHPELVRVVPEIRFVRSYWITSYSDTHLIRRIAACRSFLVQRFREERARFSI